MIAHSNLRGTGVMGCEQSTEVTFHHTFLISVHVAGSTAKTRCRLRFFAYVKPLKTPTLLHYFITSLYHFSSIFFSQKCSLFFLNHCDFQNPNCFKGTPFTSWKTPQVPLLLTTLWYTKVGGRAPLEVIMARLLLLTCLSFSNESFNPSKTERGWRAWAKTPCNSMQPNALGTSLWPLAST